MSAKSEGFNAGGAEVCGLGEFEAMVTLAGAVEVIFKARVVSPNVTTVMFAEEADCMVTLASLMKYTVNELFEPLPLMAKLVVVVFVFCVVWG